MKSIKLEIIKEIITFIKNSSFYNKIQIITKGSGVQTETFYFMKEGIGHAILIEKEDGQVETVQESHMVDDAFIYNRLSSIEEGAKVIIASNTPDLNILSIEL